MITKGITFQSLRNFFNREMRILWNYLFSWWYIFLKKEKLILRKSLRILKIFRAIKFS